MFNRVKNLENGAVNSRRSFLKLVAGTGAGLTLGLNLPNASANVNQSEKLNDNGQFEPNAFVQIDTQGKVHVMIKHLEMGQGSYTGLSTLVAEELDANWDDVVAHGAPASPKYNNLLWGAQGTGGSSGIANSFEQMRLAGATAKAMLVAAAAAQWQVPEKEITVSNGTISHKGSKRSTGFGPLVEQAAKLPVPPANSVVLKQPSEFRYIGQKLSRKDVGKTDGSAIFTQDFKLPGMLTAVVAHAPRFGAKIKRFDATSAKKVNGVVDVVQIPSGIAVVAQSFWQAKKGRDQLKVDWDEQQALKLSSEELMQNYRELADKPGLPAKIVGNAEQALAELETVIEADFEFPYLAHAAMEPMNCVAQVDTKGCQIWNGEQVHTLDQVAVAKALGISVDKVVINTLLAGGGFGRRANPASDYVLEAVHIAKSQNGVPIKLVWTREDDTQAGYYRPMYYHKLAGGIDRDGNITAWQQRIVGQSIVTGTGFEFLVKDGIDATSVEGASTLPYHIDNFAVELHTVKLPVTVQWWRSVGHTHTAFSTEVFIERLARAANKDSVALRMAMLKGHPRHQGVLKLATEKAMWGSDLPKNHALGISVHESFNTFVAQVAQVSLQPEGKFKIEKVFCAVDCGLAINPDIIKAQMEGGIGFGLSALLMSEITLDQGKVEQANFNNYQVLRINQMPEIEVHIVASNKAPTGVGEPGTPPIAAAVVNALETLTGQQFNRLPLSMQHV